VIDIKMSLTKEHKLQLAALIKEKKDILFGKFSPTITKLSKHKEWENIFNLLLANGAPVNNVHHLRKVLCDEDYKYYVVS
jgi:hypothetical protein